MSQAGNGAMQPDMLKTAAPMMIIIGALITRGCILIHRQTRTLLIGTRYD